MDGTLPRDIAFMILRYVFDDCNKHWTPQTRERKRVILALNGACRYTRTLLKSFVTHQFYQSYMYEDFRERLHPYKVRVLFSHPDGSTLTEPGIYLPLIEDRRRQWCSPFLCCCRERLLSRQWFFMIHEPACPNPRLLEVWCSGTNIPT